MKHIAVFASGSGTNAENIIKYFKNTKTASVVLVLTNNPKALVLERAAALEVKTVVFNKTQLNDAKWGIDNLADIDLIVLAGFLWKFPEHLLGTYKNKVVNIHPALLPKYGGKGMYGIHVHKAVKENNENETGITIHYVNENYDEGAVIFQAKTELNSQDTPETIAEKIHLLEQHHFPKVIEEVILAIHE